MPKIASFTIADYSHELATTQFYIDETEDISGLTTLTAALNGLHVGTLHRINVTEFDPISGNYPTNELANRELKVLIGYSDDVTGKKYTFTVPCIDSSAFVRVPGTDFLEITEAPLAAFVTAYELIGKSEMGNAVTVNYAKVVGRNG
jgi:hypothetical protein